MANFGTIYVEVITLDYFAKIRNTVGELHVVKEEYLGYTA